MAYIGVVLLYLGVHPAALDVQVLRYGDPVVQKPVCVCSTKSVIHECSASKVCARKHKLMNSTTQASSS